MGNQEDQLNTAGCYLDSRPRLRELALALCLIVLAIAAMPAAWGAPQSNPEIEKVLKPLRDQFDVPAMGAAIVTTQGMATCAVIGERKRGSHERVETSDRWHMGSDTKAMTALMCARLIEQGALSWDSTVGTVMGPQLGMTLAEGKGDITLYELLHHLSGLPPNINWHSIPRNLPLHQQRILAAQRAFSQPLLFSPGTDFKYSNLGYTMAGTMAECATGKPWEELMEQYVFGPLGMKVGEGPQCDGTSPASEPWGHTGDGKPICNDNPLVMAPAGCINCSLENWSKFIAEELRGAAGQPGLVRAETYHALFSAPEGRNYACGWIGGRRPWAGGMAFNHVGSNTYNVADAWLAPNRGFAVLVVCNQGGGSANQACDKAAFALAQYWNNQQGGNGNAAGNK